MIPDGRRRHAFGRDPPSGIETFPPVRYQTRGAAEGRNVGVTQRCALQRCNSDGSSERRIAVALLRTANGVPIVHGPHGRTSWPPSSRAAVLDSRLGGACRYQRQHEQTANALTKAPHVQCLAIE